jgi:hypothetical protein
VGARDWIGLEREEMNRGKKGRMRKGKVGGEIKLEACPDPNPIDIATKFLVSAGWSIS